MLLEVVLSIALRVSGHAECRETYVYIGDFGFYEHGTFSLTWSSPGANSAFRANLILFAARIRHLV
jgi:hypothetical protein